MACRDFVTWACKLIASSKTVQTTTLITIVVVIMSALAIAGKATKKAGDVCSHVLVKYVLIVKLITLGDRENLQTISNATRMKILVKLLLRSELLQLQIILPT